MTNHHNEMYMLVGTYTDSGSNGIYVFKLDTETGLSKYISEVEVSNPSYINLDPSEKFVYAVSEEDTIEKSIVSAFVFDKSNGDLRFINKQQTGGEGPCHINVDGSGKIVVVANYLGGNLSVFNIGKDGSLFPASQIISFSGIGVDIQRQEQPHVHYCEFSPDGKFLYADDLGTDKIHKFKTNNRDLSNYLIFSTPPFYKVSDGSGPRHLVFHPNGKYAYLITELSGDVIVFDYTNGNLKQKQSIKADTFNVKGSADIHISPDGKYLYASVRLLKDRIVIFSVNEIDGRLKKIGYQPTKKHPRNFAVTPNGNLLVVANQDSNLIQVFKRDFATGMLTNTEHDIQLEMPVCIKFASVK